MRGDNITDTSNVRIFLSCFRVGIQRSDVGRPNITERRQRVARTPETLLRGRGIDEWGFPEEGKRGGFGLLGYEGRSS